MAGNHLYIKKLPFFMPFFPLNLRFFPLIALKTPLNVP
nr:MAG TPA: hypothetical protein [Caudoviricetes sp.]